MTRVRYATVAAPGGVNEDYVIAGPSWVVVLDGATAPLGVDSGCVHDVSWLVRTLAGALAVRLDGDESLPGVLARAIAATMDAHAATCDLGNPNSPSCTVAIARRRGDGGIADPRHRTPRNGRAPSRVTVMEKGCANGDSRVSREPLGGLGR